MSSWILETEKEIFVGACCFECLHGGDGEGHFACYPVPAGVKELIEAGSMSLSYRDLVDRDDDLRFISYPELEAMIQNRF